MLCLKNYIGVKYCGYIPNQSGMYIQQLAGIEFSGIESLASSEQQTWAGVWDDIQERAIERFRVDVIGRLSGFDKRYKLRQITQTVDLGNEYTDTLVLPEAKRKGIVIELNQPNAQLVCSNMQAIYIQSLQFYLYDDGDYSIVIADAELGNVIDTFAYTGATAGWNSIYVDKQYDYQRVSITVDCTSLTTVTKNLSGFNLSGFSNNSDIQAWYNSGFWVDYGCSGSAQVRGITTDLNYRNALYTDNTYGVSCIFSVRCTYNGIVCKNKRYFASAFRLLLGSELMAERMYSSRINKWTTVDAKKAERLRTEFEVQYRGGILKSGEVEASYEGELNQAIQSIDLNLSDCCLECSETIIWRETQM